MSVRTRRRLVAGALATVTLIATAAVWGNVRIRSAESHLMSAAGLVQRYQHELRNADPAIAAGTLARLQKQTRAARSDVHDPAWRLGAGLPIAGDDLAAVRTVAVTLDDLAHDGLPALSGAAALFGEETPRPVRGRFDLTSIERAAPELALAEQAFRKASTKITAIPTDGLTEPVRDAVVRLRTELHRASGLVTTASKAIGLLPAMLGTGRPRTYLALFQNLAEVRATGGMPGAFVVIEAHRGHIRIVDQGTATGLRPFPRPVLPLTAADRQLYSDKLGTFPADINLTPHFPTTAALAREMYRRRSGVTVDAVLATDPVALSYLLQATGPVPVPGGWPLTAGNAVPTLLSRIYADEFEPERQDAYFAAAARAAFRALLRRPLEPEAIKAFLSRAVRERRLLLWSSRPEEQLLLEQSTVAGILPAGDGQSPLVGVFLNDGSGAKLGFYLTHRAEVTVTPACRGDGRRELTLRVDLGSTAPKTGLSRHVLGLGLAGNPYTVRTNVSVYSPVGGALVAMDLDGEPKPFGTGRDRRRAVGIATLDVPPGTTRTLRVRLLSGVPADGYTGKVTPRLWLTPGIAPWPQTTESGQECPSSR
jgi:hypothetical protein